jgi:hypothetical protein
MQRCYDAAMADCRVLEPGIRRDLYAGTAKDGFRFPPQPQWSVDKQLAWGLALLRGETDGIPEEFIDWHELAASNARPVGKMAAYEAAAAMFNVLLAEAQRHGYRTSEHPTNGSALQRALSRRQDGEKRRKSLAKKRKTARE